nr:MAG TPA: hypothetical protein [Caudoviricetes sp.]
MYLLPSRIKTKYRPYRQFYNIPRLSKRSLSVEEVLLIDLSQGEERGRFGARTQVSEN